MATLSNTKVFSHADMKFPLPSNKRLVGGRGFYVKLHTKFKFEHAICALTAIESESIALSSSSETQIGSDWNFGASQDDSQEDSGIDEKEILRRSRISRANKGNTPWNKGRKHSPETIQRIRERTKIAMQNSKVKKKLLKLGHPQSSETQIGSDWNFGVSQDDSHENSGIDEKEILRRSRISRANKGNTPWNKGRKHSLETIQRIRERTKIAMQDSKVKKKLLKLGHPQRSDDTKSKIAQGVKEGWRRRRERIMIQLRCHVEWCNTIAEVARVGFSDETELQWDSCELLQEELK